METKKQRIKNRLQILCAIRDGKDFIKSRTVLGPLQFGDLITIKYLDEQIVDATITDIGKQYIAFFGKKYGAK